MPDAQETGQTQSAVLAVIIFLGLFALVGLGGVIGLLVSGNKSDVAPVTTLVGSAIGGLAAMLASTSSKPRPSKSSDQRGQATS
jgi:hypothetical protein